MEKLPLHRPWNGAIGHGFAGLMTVSARSRVKNIPAGLVDLMVLHILKIYFVVQNQKNIKLSTFTFKFVIYGLLRVSGSTPDGKYEKHDRLCRVSRFRVRV